MTDQRYGSNNVLAPNEAAASSSKLSGSGNGKGLSKVGSSAFNSRERQTGSASKFVLN